jgi:hypothetical protein
VLLSRFQRFKFVHCDQSVFVQGDDSYGYPADRTGQVHLLVLGLICFGASRPLLRFTSGQTVYFSQSLWRMTLRICIHCKESAFFEDCYIFRDAADTQL